MARDYNEYDDLGVRFVYPRNWFVNTETLDKGTYTITVDSPEGSFWALAIMPKNVDLDHAAKEIVKSMKAEYDELEECEIKQYVADTILTGYEINFFYLDLSSTAVALKFEDDRRGYVIYWQTCERMSLSGETLSRIDIFDAITHTLISNLTGQEADWGDIEDDLQYDKVLSERELREQEDREFFRRKYERARLEAEQANWRRSVDPSETDEEEDSYYRFPCNDREDVLDGFLRVDEQTAESLRQYNADLEDDERRYYDGLERDESNDEEECEELYNEDDDENNG